MRKKLHPLEGILMKSMVADATFFVYGKYCIWRMPEFT